MNNDYFDNKNKYLSKFNGEDLRVKTSRFKKFSIIENELGKDLVFFSKKEFEYFFEKLEVTSLTSLQNIVIILSNYIEFERMNGNKVKKLSTHPIQEFKIGSDLEKFLKDDDLVISRNKLYSIAKVCENFQDAIALILLFEGVSYRNDMEELRDIKISEIDFINNRVFLKKRNDYLKLSNETMRVLSNSINEIYYYSILGTESRRYNLMNTGYLFRGIRGNGKISTRNINQRISRVAIRNNLSINATTIANSGQLNYLMEIQKNISKEDMLEKALVRYGMNINDSSKHYLKIRLSRYKLHQKSKI